MNNSTCPKGKLEPTYWDRPDQYEYFKDLNILLSSTAPRSTSSPSSTASAGSDGSSGPSNAVIGGAAGGTLGFVALLAFIIILLWRRKKLHHNRNQDGASGEPASSMEGGKPEAGELASPVSVGTGMLFQTELNHRSND